MRTFEADNGEVVLQLEPGDKALESIEAAVDEHDIDTGYVASGIGSLTQLHVHYVSGYDSFPEFPEEDEEIDEYVKEEAAWEVGSLQGVIADGEPHLHITAFDADREKMLAGHLEPDSIVHALMEIVVKPIEGLDLTRRPAQMDIPMLEET